MVLMTMLTVLRFFEIENFKKNSKEYAIVLDDNYDISGVKSYLQDFTFQEVLEEELDGGRYRLVIKCPPDRFKNILNKINNDFK